MNKQIFRMVADFECKGSKKNRICQVYWGNVHVFMGIIIDNVRVVEILYRLKYIYKMTKIFWEEVLAYIVGTDGKLSTLKRA